jgi:hypothetical protein
VIPTVVPLAPLPVPDPPWVQYAYAPPAAMRRTAPAATTTLRLNLRNMRGLLGRCESRETIPLTLSVPGGGLTVRGETPPVAVPASAASPTVLSDSRCFSPFVERRRRDGSRRLYGGFETHLLVARGAKHLDPDKAPVSALRATRDSVDSARRGSSPAAGRCGAFRRGRHGAGSPTSPDIPGWRNARSPLRERAAVSAGPSSRR